MKAAHSPPRWTERTGSLWTRSVSGSPTTAPPVRCSTTDSVNAGGKVHHHRQSNSAYVDFKVVLKTLTSTTKTGIVHDMYTLLQWLIKCTCIMNYMKVNVVSFTYFSSKNQYLIFKHNLYRLSSITWRSSDNSSTPTV